MFKRTLFAALASVMVLSSPILTEIGHTAPGASATVTSLVGSVQTRTRVGWRNTINSQRLYPGMTVRTGGRSRLQIRYDDGSVVRLGSRSILRVRQARNLRLMRGKTWIKKKKDQARPLRVRTPIAQATVIGTELFVSHNDKNVSHITTLTGHVEVETDKGEKTTVHPGMWVEIEPNKPLEEPTKFDWNELKKNERFLLDLNFIPPEDEPEPEDEDWR